MAKLDEESQKALGSDMDTISGLLTLSTFNDPKYISELLDQIVKFLDAIACSKRPIKYVKQII